MIRCDGSVFRDFPVAQLSNYISKLCYLKTVASRVQYRGYYLLTMLELRVLTDKSNHLHILFFFFTFFFKFQIYLLLKVLVKRLITQQQ